MNQPHMQSLNIYDMTALNIYDMQRGLGAAHHQSIGVVRLSSPLPAVSVSFTLCDSIGMGEGAGPSTWVCRIPPCSGGGSYNAGLWVDLERMMLIYSRSRQRICYQPGQHGQLTSF